MASTQTSFVRIEEAQGVLEMLVEHAIGDEEQGRGFFPGSNHTPKLMESIKKMLFSLQYFFQQSMRDKLQAFSSEFLVGWRAEDLEDEEDSTTVMVIPDFFQESLNRLRVENQAYKDRVKAEEELMERMQHRLNTVVSVVNELRQTLYKENVFFREKLKAMVGGTPYETEIFSLLQTSFDDVPRISKLVDKEGMVFRTQPMTAEQEKAMLLRYQDEQFRRMTERFRDGQEENVRRIHNLESVIDSMLEETFGVMKSVEAFTQTELETVEAKVQTDPVLFAPTERPDSQESVQRADPPVRPATEGVFPRANNPWESRPLFKAQEGIGLGTSDENPTRWGWAASSAGVESGEFNLMEDVHPAQLLFEENGALTTEEQAELLRDLELLRQQNRRMEREIFSAPGAENPDHKNRKSLRGTMLDLRRTVREKTRALDISQKQKNFLEGKHEVTISKLENSLEKQLRKQESQAAEMELRVKEATQRLKNENDELAELILQLEDEKDQLLKELASYRSSESKTSFSEQLAAGKTQSRQQLENVMAHAQRRLQIAHGQFGSLSDLYKEVENKFFILDKRFDFYRQEAETDKKELPPDAPTGYMALVFTDVEKSTPLWEGCTTSMVLSMRVHNRIMRSLLKKHNGYEVKTEGDGAMLAFQRPFNAVNFCLEFQLSLLKKSWPKDILEYPWCAEEYHTDSKGNQMGLMFRGLRVRMGIHAGEPICMRDPTTKRADYFGPVVNMAARISGGALGGQILVSPEIMGEMEARPRCVLPFHAKDLGEFSLKGICESVKMFQILPHELRHRKFPEDPLVYEEQLLAAVENELEPPLQRSVSQTLHQIQKSWDMMGEQLSKMGSTLGEEEQTDESSSSRPKLPRMSSIHILQDVDSTAPMSPGSTSEGTTPTSTQANSIGRTGIPPSTYHVPTSSFSGLLENFFHHHHIPSDDPVSALLHRGTPRSLPGMDTGTQYDPRDFLFHHVHIMASPGDMHVPQPVGTFVLHSTVGGGAPSQDSMAPSWSESGERSGSLQHRDLAGISAQDLSQQEMHTLMHQLSGEGGGAGALPSTSPYLVSEPTKSGIHMSEDIWQQFQGVLWALVQQLEEAIQYQFSQFRPEEHRSIQQMGERLPPLIRALADLPFEMTQNYIEKKNLLKRLTGRNPADLLTSVDDQLRHYFSPEKMEAFKQVAESAAQRREEKDDTSDLEFQLERVHSRLSKLHHQVNEIRSQKTGSDRPTSASSVVSTGSISGSQQGSSRERTGRSPVQGGDDLHRGASLREIMGLDQLGAPPPTSASLKTSEPTTDPRGGGSRCRPWTQHLDRDREQDQREGGEDPRRLHSSQHIRLDRVSKSRGGPDQSRVGTPIRSSNQSSNSRRAAQGSLDEVRFALEELERQEMLDAGCQTDLTLPMLAYHASVLQRSASLRQQNRFDDAIPLLGNMPVIPEGMVLIKLSELEELHQQQEEVWQWEESQKKLITKRNFVRWQVQKELEDLERAHQILSDPEKSFLKPWRALGPNSNISEDQFFKEQLELMRKGKVPHLFAELEELSRRLSPSPPARGSERVGKGTVPSHSRETASTSTIRKGASPAILPTSTFSQRETSIGGPSDALSPMSARRLELLQAHAVRFPALVHTHAPSSSNKTKSGPGAPTPIHSPAWVDPAVITMEELQQLRANAGSASKRPKRSSSVPPKHK